jgi:hypothetical protein
MQGHVAIAAPLRREINDAQLFTQSAHAPDQTDQQPQLIHCLADLAAPLFPFCHSALFHEILRAEGPG